MSESIMIVEDEGVVALELEQCLTQLGYSVPAIVPSGEEAIEKALQLAPDLVLMDIRLKGAIDGIEAARRIMDTQGIPVVYLTAYSDDVTIGRAKDSAPFGYVLKPWEEKSLQIAIDMALHKAELEAEVREQRDWYFSVLRYMGAPMIVCDAAGAVKFVNASAEQLLAVEPAPDKPRLLGEILEVRERPGSVPTVSVLDTLLARDGVWSQPLFLSGRDNVELPIDLTTVPIMGEKNSVLGFVLFLRPQNAEDENSSPDRRITHDLQEYLQTELIRLLILQEQAGKTTDRFVEGQLDAYRRLMRRFFGDSADGGESDWRRRLVRSAVRDAHEQTRSILLGHSDIARTGRVSQAKLERYVSVTIRRLAESHSLEPSDVRASISIGPADVDLGCAIFAVLMVNELVEQAFSSGVSTPIEVSIDETGGQELRLTLAYVARDTSRPIATTAVLDALVAEVHGSLSIRRGPKLVWEILFGGSIAE